MTHSNGEPTSHHLTGEMSQPCSEATICLSVCGHPTLDIGESEHLKLVSNTSLAASCLPDFHLGAATH